MSEKRVVVDLPLQRRRASSLRGTRPPSSLDSPPASRTGIMGSLGRAPGVYVGTAPSGYTGGLGARVTRRALRISSVFLQGLRSSGLTSVAAPGLERDHREVEDLGGCLVDYIAKVHALEQISQELETQLRTHLESKAKRSGGWDALRASWSSSCQQGHMPVVYSYNSSRSGGLRAKDPSLEDVKLLYKQLLGSELERVDVPSVTGLDGILETIRVQWERDAEKNRAEAGALLQAKQQAEVALASQTQEEKLAAALRVDLHNASCEVQSLQAETESLRALKRGLENSLHDAKHWHEMELQNLGAVVGRLEAELSEIRAEAEQQLQQRAHLLASRGQLQRDLETFHALLDRDESS
ncbi:PREDICTED: phakinin [Dipodomys ordii]|uniref:Phakinin n=1 Tax=Dipodomys ordii TaxID=10020 RepID=A0A1S3G634_DIPOR|nr:PREDICTED: phakinin [Dipodomys ordii]